MTTDLLQQIAEENKARYQELERAQTAVDEIESRPLVYRKLRIVFGRFGQVVWYWKQLILGLVIISLISAVINVELPDWNFRNDNSKPNKVVNNIQTIVKNAPSDTAKRTKIATVYNSVATSINNGILTNKEAVFVTIKTETASIIADPQWKQTIADINKILTGHETLDGLATELKNIAEEFKK